MDAKELRIGNLVEWDRSSSNNKNEEVVIYNISRTQVRVFTDIEELSEVLLNLSDIKPIRLTNELLIRMGYEKIGTVGLSGIVFRQNYQEIHSIYNKFEFYFCNEYYKEIEFAHQLQNISLLITNEELTIKQC